MKFVSKHREERLTVIAERLAAYGEQYDIVALQEIWVESDFEKIKELTAQQFRYRKYFYSGILAGPGLLILSKWPIESASLFRFPLNGRPSAFFRGDWYVGKSAASCVIRHPVRKIEIINTHMHAPYGPGDAAYTCHRTAQAWELTRQAKRASDCGHLVVVVGDMNSVPGSLTHRLFDLVAQLSDSWQDCHGEFKGDIGSLTPEDQIIQAGTTCDSQLNTWRAQRKIDEACRLDYIFYDSSYARVQDARVSFIDPIPGIGSVSDHFAAETDLIIADEVEPKKPASSEDLRLLYTDMLELIDDYKSTSIMQAKIRNYHFIASVLVLIALLISVFWGAAHNRAWVGFLFMLVAIVVAVTGLLDGLMGFLFGRCEMRGLREFESEVELARHVLE